jgi:nucleobase:cation symporter-1, NCS1 family
LEDLYKEGGRYWFTGGWNIPALVATLVGAVLAVGGAHSASGTPFPEDGLIPFLKELYNYSWLVGLVAASLVYLLLSARSTSRESAPAPAPVPEGEAVV